MSSSREGSQERRMSEEPPVSRPPLVRRPSWRRQSHVLQKARKFEAAYLKQRQDEQLKNKLHQNRYIFVSGVNILVFMGDLVAGQPF